MRIFSLAAVVFVLLGCGAPQQKVDLASARVLDSLLLFNDYGELIEVYGKENVRVILHTIDNIGDSASAAVLFPGTSSEVLITWGDNEYVPAVEYYRTARVSVKTLGLPEASTVKGWKTSAGVALGMTLNDIKALGSAPRDPVNELDSVEGWGGALSDHRFVFDPGAYNAEKDPRLDVLSVVGFYTNPKRTYVFVGPMGRETEETEGEVEVGGGVEGEVEAEEEGTPPRSNPNFLSDYGYTNGGWRNSQTVRLAADVNGDGKADIVGYSGNGVLVSFSQGTSFGPVAWLVDKDFEGWSFASHVRTTGDFNGDGKADLIAFGDEGTYAAISNGAGFGPLHLVLDNFGNRKGGWDAAVTVRCVGDVNGDGKADAIGFSSGDVRVAFSDGNSLGTVQILNSDFQDWSYTDHVRTVADVDGDGKADLVGFGSKGTYVCFSTGAGFESAELMTSDFGNDKGWDTETMRRIMADVNGDGKSDILGYNTDKVVVSYSKGRSGFAAAKVISYDFNKRQGYDFNKYVVTAADVDGNRKADLIGFGNLGVIVQLTR